MDRSLNEAARDIGRAMQQLTDAMRDKGYPEAHAQLSIDAPQRFTIWLKAGAKVNDGLGYCTASTLGEAYTKADAAIAAMPDRAAERAAS